MNTRLSRIYNVLQCSPRQQKELEHITCLKSLKLTFFFPSVVFPRYYYYYPFFGKIVVLLAFCFHSRLKRTNHIDRQDTKRMLSLWMHKSVWVKFMIKTIKRNQWNHRLQRFPYSVIKRPTKICSLNFVTNMNYTAKWLIRSKTRATHCCERKYRAQTQYSVKFNRNNGSVNWNQKANCWNSNELLFP